MPEAGQLSLGGANEQFANSSVHQVNGVAHQVGEGEMENRDTAVVVGASAIYPALANWRRVSSLPKMLSHLVSWGWRPYIVGGWVRDAVLGDSAKDLDIECYSEEQRGIDELELCLGQVATDVERVGVSFGVLKVYLPGYHHPIDVSLPRRERKTEKGHKGFDVTYDGRMSPKKASSRRDFTFNALMYDPLQDTLYDFWGGIRDLQNGILRHISPAFVEDPLRVLRGFRFCSQFGLSPAPETVEMCRQLRAEFSALARERIGNEFLLWSGANLKQPSAGMMFLRETGWGELFPPFAKMMETQCVSTARGEDLWECAATSADALSRLLVGEEKETRRHLMLAVLSFGMCVGSGCLCTETDVVSAQERIAKLSPHITEFWSNLGISKKIADRIARLGCSASVLPRTPADVRILSYTLSPATIREWYMLAKSVYGAFSGRGREIEEMYNVAKREQITESPPSPLITGATLLRLGFQEGPQIGEIIRKAYWAQLRGEFSSLPGGVRWVFQNLPVTDQENIRRTEVRHV